METLKLQLCAQSCIYAGLFISSLFVCIPVGVSVTRFNGHCLLSSRGHWVKQQTTSELVSVNWGPDSSCNFTIFISVISLIFALFGVAWMSVVLVRGLERSRLDIVINLVVDAIMCICFFSTAVTVSIGFREWCELVTNSPSEIERCEDGDSISFGSSVYVNTLGFFTHWQIAQFGVWSCWILWLVLFVWSLIKLYSHYRWEAFMTSVNRERERLLGVHKDQNH